MSPTRPKGGLGRGLGALIPQGPMGPSSAPVSVVDPPRAEPTTGVATETPPRSWVGGEHELAPVPGATFAEIAVAAIKPNARQPRQGFDEETLEDLKTSIREVGFLQPIVVRETGDNAYE